MVIPITWSKIYLALRQTVFIRMIPTQEKCEQTVVANQAGSVLEYVPAAVPAD